MVSDLPQEILIDIFSRLPAKSVGQCRCLSKQWRDILSSPHFIKSHLNRGTHQQSRILIAKHRSFHSIATIKGGAVSRELELPFDCAEIVGSCHGLVLFANKKYDDKFLVNPVTLDQVKIPNSPLALNRVPRNSVSIHGFGYDSCVDDYKIVTLSYYNYRYHRGRDNYEPFVDVYSVKRGVWKRVETCSPCSRAVIPAPNQSRPAFFNGAIHWLAFRREPPVRHSGLIVFDLFHEVFTEIPAPEDIRNKYFLCELVVLGGCLCIIHVQNSSKTNVWIMKEYGLAESWTKVMIDTGDEFVTRKPLYFVGDREIVSAAEGEKLRDMIVAGVPNVLFDDGIAFVPSLVSPANGTNMEDRHAC